VTLTIRKASLPAAEQYAREAAGSRRGGNAAITGEGRLAAVALKDRWRNCFQL